MFKFIFPLVLALGSLIGVGCQTDEGPRTRVTEVADMPGLKLSIAGPDLDQGKVREITSHLEGKAVETGAAMVKIKKDDQGRTTTEIELFAKTLPSGDVVAELQAKFPELAGATITASPAQAGALAPLPIVEVDRDLSPEEAQAQIVEQLKADGVDGDIKVEVEDGENERRIEVKVEKKDCEPQP